jgi:Tfp pilus assembly protein PilO
MALILAGFYLKVLGPKRDQAASLKKDVAGLQAQIDEQKQVADFAEDARKHFPTYYGRLVVLGKAVPANADTGSLLVELNSIATGAGVKFSGLQLSTAAGTSAPAPASAPTDSSSATSGTDSSSAGAAPSTDTAASAPTVPTAATEATAANLPLGASVGAAGLPVMPYDLTFEGTYFDVADFLKGVDDMVHVRGTSYVSADGRLLTIDGFSLQPAQDTSPSDPKLDVSLAVTSYVTPSDQGLTAGATPGGPAPSVTTTQPASATVAP